MSVVKSIIDYFERYTEIPNSALVRDLVNKIAAADPSLVEEDVFLETITELRTDFGYRHPIEELADINDAAPFLAKTSRRGSKEIG